MTVREIGKICKKYNNKINLIYTKDKIPYKGYYMNSSKIIKTKFKYKHFYKEFVKEVFIIFILEKILYHNLKFYVSI